MAETASLVDTFCLTAATSPDEVESWTVTSISDVPSASFNAIKSSRRSAGFAAFLRAILSREISTPMIWAILPRIASFLASKLACVMRATRNTTCRSLGVATVGIAVGESLGEALRAYIGVRVNVADGSADEVLAGVVGGALGVGVD